MRTQNVILADIVVASGGTVTLPATRNSLLADWLLAAGGGGGGLPLITPISWVTGGSNLLVEESKSLKLLPYNGQVSASPTDYGYLQLDTAGVGTMFEIGVDGLFFVSVDLPQESMDANKQYNLFGGSLNGGRTMHISYFGGAHFTVADRYKFKVSIKGSTGALVTLTTAPTTLNKIVVAITKNGDAFTVKVIDCEAGAVINGDTQISVDTQLNSPLDFWVGYAGSFTGPSLPLASSASLFSGSIESFGYVDITPTDAMLIDYALGNGLDDSFGLPNIRFSRQLRGVDATSLAAVVGTPDPTPPLLTFGAAFNTGGSVRRGDKAKYLQLVDKFNGYVAGIKKANTSAIFPVSGISSESSGIVQARVVWDDGTTYSAWTDFAEIEGSGNWEGKLQAVKMTTWGYIEVRLKQDTVITSISRKEAGFGYKIYFPNQSQCRIMATDDALGVKPITGKGSVFKLGNTPDTGLQSYVFNGAFANSDGLSAMIDYLGGVTDSIVSIVSDAISGTSAREWIDDTATGSTNRLWSDTVAILDEAGKDTSAIVWQWGSSDNVGLSYGDVFDAVLDGTGPFAADHYINDGTFEAGFELAVSPFSRSTTQGVGPFDFDSNNVGLTRVGQVNWVEANPTKATLGPYVNDMAITVAGPHQPTGDVKGSTRLALRMAEAAARSLGLTTNTNPEMSLLLTNSTTITGTVTLPNGGAIKTDGLASIQGFEISVDAGVTWSRSGFMGSITSSNEFELTKDATTWATGTMVRYQSGSPLGYGSSVEPSRLYEGCLYDGTAIEGGLGMPVAPTTLEI